jgi:predicted transcriptional regulator
MGATLTIDLPEEVIGTLQQAAREDGVSESAFAINALVDYMRLRQSGSIRPGIAAKEDIDGLLRTMDRIRQSAERNGLTPEILETILNDK